MLRPVLKPSGRIPAQSLVRDDWANGLTPHDMALAYGVSLAAIDAYLRPRLQRWERECVAPLHAIPGAVITTRLAFSDRLHVSRRIRISLAHNSMHLQILEGRQASHSLQPLDTKLVEFHP